MLNLLKFQRRFASVLQEQGEAFLFGKARSRFATRGGEEDDEVVEDEERRDEKPDEEGESLKEKEEVQVKRNQTRSKSDNKIQDVFHPLDKSVIQPEKAFKIFTNEVEKYKKSNSVFDTFNVFVGHQIPESVKNTKFTTGDLDMTSVQFLENFYSS